MSLLKAKKLQVGTHATPTNNFVIEQPDTPDGTLRIGVGNEGASTDIMTFDSSGASVSGSFNVSGSFSQGSGIEYARYVTNGQQDTTWKVIADLSLGTSSYAGCGFVVDVFNAQGNFGQSTHTGDFLRYAISAVRSSGVVDNPNAGYVAGPVADYVRLVKVSTGVYEVQARQIADYRHIMFNIYSPGGSSVTSLSYPDVSSWTELSTSSAGTAYTANTTAYNLTFQIPSITVTKTLIIPVV